jgi:hypothetical protein
VTLSAAEYAAQAPQAFDEAVAAAGCRERTIELLGQRIRLRFAGEAIERLLARGLDHLVVSADGSPALTVGIFGRLTSGVSMPRPAWGIDDYSFLGEVGRAESGARVAYDMGAGAVSIFDAETATAFYWARDEIPAWERSAPLRTVLHWWLGRRGATFAHGGVVGLDGVGVLLAGRGGAGKSTTALACALSGLDYLGDDYVGLLPGERPEALSLYSSAKVTDRSIELLPGLARFVSARSEDEEKSLLFLHPELQAQLVPRVALSAAVVPELGQDGRSRLEPVSQAAAFRALAVSTVYQVPGRGAETLRTAGSLLRALPAYRLTLGSDPLEAAGLIRELVAR